MGKRKAIEEVQETVLPAETEPENQETKRPDIPVPELTETAKLLESREHKDVPEWLELLMKEQKIRKPKINYDLLEIDDVVQFEGSFWKVAKVGTNAFCMLLTPAIRDKRYTNKEEETNYYTKIANGNNSSTISMRSEIDVYCKMDNIEKPKVKRRAV